jgi:hypothetical protein
MSTLHKEHCLATYTAATPRNVAGRLVSIINEMKSPAFIFMSEDLLRRICDEVGKGEETVQKAILSKKFLGYPLCLDPVAGDVAKVSNHDLSECMTVKLDTTK